jgi:3-methyladenine DNA glycosylase AlkC
VPSLKEQVNDAVVRTLADALVAASPDFPRAAFLAAAGDGLERLELKDRIRHVADAVQGALPDDVPTVVAVIDGAIATGTLDGWSAWPLTELAGRLGPDAPAEVLPLLARLTTVMSCEFAIRPCLAAHPEETFAHLERWADDPDERVRRLVSEGTRPRLPWGERLRELQADPTPSLRLLDRLREDPSPTVRRSVANHLGDIAKDHPDLAVATARRWRDEGGEHVDEVVRHGLRALVKAGAPDALALLGYDAAAPVRLRSFTVEPGRVAIGGVVQLTVALTVDGTAPVPVVVEYVVTYLGPRGPRKPKPYRLAERVVAPGEEVRLRRRHRFDHASIRTLHHGVQSVAVQANGRVLGSSDVELTP